MVTKPEVVKEMKLLGGMGLVIFLGVFSAGALYKLIETTIRGLANLVYWLSN